MFVLASNRWRGFAAILIFQLFAFAGGNPAFAWGNVAHRAIAAVAEPTAMLVSVSKNTLAPTTVVSTF